ncbi:molybdate ABC transporter substrate-binding protein [Chelatococcus sp. SYSU_G07232]|uniref:Molybdate ABC transporter substrate-binding protein n=1 Tax=Chelatococcus albus TaxID=3047466 RepID=A0ABT7ALA9_9HYPH|nr:molybdate ABC transporter substrate-binding protein [Chelatococcus sp. SYSU_G07232]MDJ1160160.1 molybdate ABC transporter substrate-binding protein [Chelatococcus sp. SYSU_G07232]
MTVAIRRRSCLAALVALVLGAALWPGPPAPPAVAQGSKEESELVILAAASMKNALDELNAAWEQETGRRARISYAASSALARQIEQGAPADVIISADLDWMDYLVQRGLIRADTRANRLGNRLVLIAPKESKAAVSLAPGVDLARLLGDGRLAMASTAAVPAGKYGKAALEKLGAWEGVKARVAEAENVRAALLLVSRGEAPLGIVYATDAAADPAVRVVATFPADTHPPIIYPVAQTTASSSLQAKAFLAFLNSPAARPVFERQGFTVLK